MKIFSGKKSFEGLSLYRFMICMGLFILFVAVVTPLIHRGITNKRYEVGLKQALFILSEAMVYVTAESPAGDDGNDIYYWYLLDVLNKNFKSSNCNHTKNLACPAAEYLTKNGRARMSDLIFKGGENIVIAGKLFRLNIPVAPDEPLLVTVDTNGGTMKPNKLGYDVFVFQVLNRKLRAMGAKDTIYPVENYEFYCREASTSKDELFGVNCTYPALTDYNYFKDLK